MIDKLIEDIDKALDADAYLSALALVLILPDICGIAEYGKNTSVGKRYINWFDKYISNYEITNNEFFCNHPYLSGEVVYRLRCCLLHQGNPNIDKEKITEERNKIDEFILITQKKDNFDIYIDSSSISYINNDIKNAKRSYKLNIRRLCLIICSTVKGYYNENKNKFDFFNFKIVDYDKELENHNKIKKMNLQIQNEEGED